MMTEELSPALVERVLSKLGFSERPAPELGGLTALYTAWCTKVPFDNVRKLIHVRTNDPGRLPGDDPADFFEGWLKYGTGGTCWAGNGTLQALLSSLGFNAVRGVATMMVAPDLPPNHGTVVVSLGNEQYLVDASILHGSPLPLLKQREATRVAHRAWGVIGTYVEPTWKIAWRPLHTEHGIDCRIDYLNATRQDFEQRHEQSRQWSPFNYSVYARRNTGTDTVIGVAFGKSVLLDDDQFPKITPMEHHERQAFLIEKLGMSEEIISRLPDDMPTPPPPGSNKARESSPAVNS
jgi:N-hydroxyarylamine O-acetyltransferase